MRLLLPISHKVTDKTILRLYGNNLKFVSDYQPNRNSKIYFNPVKKTYIEKFSSSHKWVNGHRIIDKFYHRYNKWIAPFAYYNTIVYPNGKTVIIDKNKQNIWQPDIYIGHKKLKLVGIKFDNKTVTFDYGIIKRVIKIYDWAVKEFYYITDYPDSFVKIIPNFSRRDIESDPYYIKDGQNKYFPMVTDGTVKYIPLPLFDIMKLPIEIDDSYTATLSNKNNNVADCSSIDVNDFFIDGIVGKTGTSFGDSDIEWDTTPFSFNDNISGNITSANLTLKAYGDSNGSSYYLYLNNNLHSFVSGTYTATIYTYDFNVLNDVTGVNDTGRIDFENCDGYYIRVNSIDLVIEYSSFSGAFGSNI